MEATSTIAERYQEDGYLVFRDVLDVGLIEEAQAHVAWLRKRRPDLRPENLHYKLVYDDPFWVRLVSDDRLLDIAEAFMGPDLALFASHYVAKPPREGMPVLWHQDGSYWPLEPMQVVSLWLAVTPSTPENGCMRVIPGSHTLDLQELHQRQDVDNVLGSEISQDVVEESKAVDVVLEPGDVSVHHPNIIHGSNANTSDQWRIGLTIRYIPTSTRVLLENHEVLLMRGDSHDNGNVYSPQPRYDEGRHMPFLGCEAWG